MSTFRLDKLFAPRSMALVGASPRPGSLGRTVLDKLREAKFPGSLWLVNPRHRAIDGIAAVPDIGSLPETPDVIVVTAPAPAVPEIIDEAGRKGVAAAVVISGGLGHGAGSLGEAARRAARTHGLRLIGPNGLGVIVPPARLNASFATRMPVAGDIALISQSGAVAAGLVEWAAKRAVGFSAIVSIGDAVDVDFGDLLDYFALDPRTRTIVLYIEAITDAPKFMSAARAAARVKPVVVVKSGRHAPAAKAAATHTGALAGSDAVYAAAFRRAGLLRVFDLDELFAAIESLGRLKPFPGRRLAILTNGGGLGVLAVDRLLDLGGTLAELSEDVRARLDARLPPAWSRANPVDIIGDADAARYADALAVLLADPANDAVLVMNVPTALAPAAEAARAVANVIDAERRKGWRPKPVFSAWIGESDEAARAFERASAPHYASEADAVRGFMHLVHYREARDMLMETPPSVPEAFAPDVASARAVIAEALAAGQEWLDPLAVNRLLDCYAIPTNPAILVRNADEAAAAAGPLLREAAVVAKILSPDIVHKSEVGGVRLNLTNVEAVRRAVDDILARAAELRPAAHITGVTLHPMIMRPKARELIAGVADDPTFGPVIVFGRGGTAVEVINDKALALPPLDMNLAYDLIARTRVSRILKAYRDVPPADGTAIALTLVKLAQLVADLPEVRELDLNPLLADEHGVIAVDARVAVAPAPAAGRGRRGHPRFSIRPYPKEWEREFSLPGGLEAFVRPVRPEDEELFRSFFAAVSQEDLRLRFFAPVRDISQTFIARLIQLDYARAMAFVAVEKNGGAMLGAVRLHIDANFTVGEYAILVRSDLKGRGLGWALMQLMIEYARAEGLEVVEGQVLRENTTMLSMCQQLGFEVTVDPESSDLCIVRLRMRSA